MQLMNFFLSAKAGSLAEASKSSLAGLALFLSFAFVSVGLFTPAVESRGFFYSNYYSLAELTVGYFANVNALPAIALFVFAFLLPLTKIGVLMEAYVIPSRQISQRNLRILETLGRWAIVEVLVVSVIVSIQDSSALFHPVAMPGPYLFAIGIMFFYLALGRILPDLKALMASRSGLANYGGDDGL